jgi:hypothetical protein
MQFTEIPEAGPGGAAKMERIAGRVSGARASQRVVLFARSGTWWIQPFSDRPFTSIEPDSTWKTTTHLGTEYAALLVDAGYVPPTTTDVLPAPGRGVVAVQTVVGKPSALPAKEAAKRIYFSGYEWEVRQAPSDSAGVMHANSAENAWVDQRGRLHLRIRREAGEWKCAEIHLLRSLGYGSYSFVFEKGPRLEPGAVLGLFTYDDAEAGQNHREIDIELSQWGDPSAKNAQYVIQPYYVAANVFRFVAPATALTHVFHWAPGRVSFESLQTTSGSSRAIAEHVFTSGIPAPGNETVHLNLYTYGKSRTPLQKDVEVVIEKFEHLP